MMMDFDEFKAFYKERGYCPNDVARRKNPLNDKQLRSRYSAYVRAEEKKEARQMTQSEEDVDWGRVRDKVFKRDQTCRLFEVLDEEERALIVDSVDPQNIDPAHILPRSTYPHLKYDPENVVALNRVFHSRLDNYQNPITGSPMTKHEHAGWWYRIVGKPHIEYLKKK